MKYRKFGKTGWEISTVSVGVMQKTTAIEQKDPAFPEPCSEALHRAVDLGVNYIDLGFPWLYRAPEKYMDGIRSSLSREYRERVRLNINLPAGSLSSSGSFERGLNEQLELWGLDRVDFCTLHCINRNYIEQLKRSDFVRWAQNMLADGRVGNIGFAFHDDAHYLDDISRIWSGWSHMRMEYSLVDYRHHPGAGGLEFAQKNEWGLIAAEPLKAGRLLLPAKKNAELAWSMACSGQSRLECALQWLYNSAVISSAQFEFMSPAQAEEYIGVAVECDEEALDAFALLWDNKVREAYYADRYFKCTSCRCCMPCPEGIDAPRIIELYNDSLMFADSDIPGLEYRLEGHDRVKCVSCGTCVNSCPKHYPITQLLGLASECFAKSDVRRDGC